MPPVIGKTWRHSRARLQLTSDEAAEQLGIAGGSLRQIECETKPVSLALAYRASTLYGVPVDALIVEEDTKSDKPQPKREPVAPPKRKNGNDDRRGPKHAREVA